jgi:hypothetical protein
MLGNGRRRAPQTSEYIDLAESAKRPSTNKKDCDNHVTTGPAESLLVNRESK